MRRLLLLLIAAYVLTSAVGCTSCRSCCSRLIACEKRKNQWLIDHLTLHHRKNAPAAVAPLTAFPAAAPTYDPASAPGFAAPVIALPAQQPIYAAPQPVYAAPPVCPPVICQPITVCPTIPVCPPVNICPPVNVCPPSDCYDPCEPMWCP